MATSGAEPDKARTRFLRLGLAIIDVLTEILRDLLCQEIQPNDIYNKVYQWGFYNVNLNQFNVIKTARDYKKFDISLLYTLLRHICPNIEPPTKDWGVSKMPSQNEIIVGDDIERIRLIRNKVLGHIGEAAVPEREFLDYWSEMSAICSRMKTKLQKDYEKMLQTARNCPMDSDRESKYIELIIRLAEEDKTIKDLLQKVLKETGLTSKEYLKIEAKDGNKRTFVETLTDVGIDTLNEMVNVINKMTSESEIDQLYESIEEFLKDNKEEIENMDLQKFFEELKEKITSYAIHQPANSMRILAKFSKFIVRMRKEYRAYVKCVRGSLILLMTFSSTKDYDRYKKDLENGEIGKRILQLFLYPPFLACFGLKKEDLVVYLNGRLLTQETTLHGTSSCVHENQFVPEEYSMDCVVTFRELLSREDKDGKRTFPAFLESFLSTLIYIEISTPKRAHITPKRAIHIIVSTRSEYSKRILVRKGAYVFDKDKLDNYCIHLHLVNTIESEQLKEWLVKYRMSIYQNDEEGYVCLKWETDLREEMDTVYKHLLLNVLELAVQLKKEKLISSLLHNGPRDYEMKDEATALALHVLFKNFKTYCRPHDGTFERLLRMFLDRTTCVNRKDVEGNSVLHLAVIALDAESRDPPCKTSPDAERILQMLLDSECEINATDKNGRTPLGCICYSLHTSQSAKLGIFLLSNGADPNIDFALNGALQNIISKQLHPGVVDSSWKTLINHMIEKTDCSKVQKDGVPGIISAIKLGDVNIVKALIKRKVNIHATDGNGSSCLLLACDLEKVSERNAISTLLLQHGCPLNEVNRSGESALLKLLERITDCKEIVIKSEKSKTVAEIDLSLFNQLVCGGADMQSPRFKDSILVTLTRNGFFGAASTLVKCGYDLKKDVLFDGNNPANETLLTIAIGSKTYIRDGYDREKKKFLDLLEKYEENSIQSLLLSCRAVIRRHLLQIGGGAEIESKINQLLLPVSFKEYLSFRVYVQNTERLEVAEIERSSYELDLDVSYYDSDDRDSDDN